VIRPGSPGASLGNPGPVIEFRRRPSTPCSSTSASKPKPPPVLAGGPVVELLAHLVDYDCQPVDWPIAVVAESPDELSVCSAPIAADGRLTGRVTSGAPCSSRRTPS